MEEYILAVGIAIIVMLFFAIFVMKNVIRRINENSKKYFMDKLQDYDYLIDEKKEQLEQLQKAINILQDEKEIKKEIEDYKKHRNEIEKKLIESKKENKDEKEEVVYDVPIPKYRQEEFFNSYKKLKKQFDVNSKQILNKFIEEHKNDTLNKKYEKLQKVRQYFSKEAVYQILTLDSSEQYELIEKALNETEKKLIDLNSYNKKSFSILKMLEKIELEIKETDPTIYVYVSNDEINYDDIEKRVKTVIYKNMSEGIIIQYHNKMYDYSI